jgi:hypothetical protein
MSVFDGIDETHFITTSTSSDWYSTQSKGNKTLEVLPLGLSIQWPIHSHWGAEQKLSSLLE